MGANSSSIAELSSNEYLTRLSGQSPIDVQDPFWNGLLSFSFSAPSCVADARLLEESVIGICKNLAKNNLETGNLGALIRVFFRRASELKASSQNEEEEEASGGGGKAVDSLSTNDIFLWQTFNALFIVRTISKYLIEHLSEENVLRQFDALPGSVGASEDESRQPINVAETLLNCLVEIVVDVTVKPSTYAIHLETLNTLVTILSVQM